LQAATEHAAGTSISARTAAIDDSVTSDVDDALMSGKSYRK
jgi:hypothetical protein